MDKRVQKANHQLMNNVDFDKFEGTTTTSIDDPSLNDSEKDFIYTILAGLMDQVKKGLMSPDELNDYITGKKTLNISISKTDVADEFYVSKLHELINEYDWDKSNYIQAQDIHSYDFLHNPIEIFDTEDTGALPPLGRKLFNSLDLGDVKKSEIVSELLSDVLVAPLDNLLSILKQSISIGPIRKIIDANYQPLPYIEQKDWCSGIIKLDSC